MARKMDKIRNYTFLRASSGAKGNISVADSGSSSRVPDPNFIFFSIPDPAYRRKIKEKEWK
jgi:hypothetical protein